MPLNADTPYTTVDDYRTSINETATHNDAELETYLLAASFLIDRITGRAFDQIDSQTREYDVSGASRIVDVDDMVSVDSVTYTVNGQAAVTLSDYELQPLNAVLDHWPYRELWLQSRPPRNSRVSVTGTFGWPAVPQPIVVATQQLAAITALDGPRGTRVVTNVLSGVSEQLPQAVQDVLMQYVYQYQRVRGLGVGG